MTIKQIQLANTFDVWRITTNQLITISNDLKEGNLSTTGTLSLENPNGFENNVSLNVKAGMISGDAGLLSNVGKPASITNQKLQNNSINVINQGQVILSSNVISLGDTVYLNVANLVTVNTDTSVANIASANLVNTVHTIATRADVIANLAFNRANAVNTVAIAAFEQANTANTNGATAIAALVGYGTAINLIDANSNAAFTFANVANVRAVSAFNFANTRYSASGGTISGDVSVTGSVDITGNLTVTGNAYFIDSTTLNVVDPLIFLSASNPADILDIGFVGKYVNATADVVYTGLFRDATNKEYYAFQEYNKEPNTNHIDPAGNNFTIATLNANIRTNNVWLNGTNVALRIATAHNDANTSNVRAVSAFTIANTANDIAFAAFAKANNVGAPIPTNRLGASGDVFGEIAISNNFVYFSVNNYTGTANTWRSVPLREFEEPTPYLMMPYFFGNPGLAASIFFNAAPFSYYLPTSLTGSLVIANNRPSGVTTLTITKNGANVGTVNFTGGATGVAETGTFTFNSQVNFVRGDIFGIQNNSTPDGQMQNIMMTILGYRT